MKYRAIATVGIFQNITVSSAIVRCVNHSCMWRCPSHVVPFILLLPWFRSLANDHPHTAVRFPFPPVSVFAYCGFSSRVWTLVSHYDCLTTEKAGQVAMGCFRNEGVEALQNYHKDNKTAYGMKISMFNWWIASYGCSQLWKCIKISAIVVLSLWLSPESQHFAVHYSF